MKKRLTCRQVEALINFYNEGCLTELLTKYVEEHLDSCSHCREKFFKQEIIDESIIDNTIQSKQYENFLNNLSAYIDNELDDLENIKIKKTAISNPNARQDLEDMYNFKKTLHLAFEKTQNDFKTDFSKPIIKELDNKNANNFTFYKLAGAFFVMLVILMTGLFKLLHF